MKIDKHIPIPSLTPSGRITLFPFMEMEVGDSVVLSNVEMRKNFLNCAKQTFKGTRRFVSKTIVEDGKQVIRAWRVK